MSLNRAVFHRLYILDMVDRQFQMVQYVYPHIANIDDLQSAK